MTMPVKLLDALRRAPSVERKGNFSVFLQGEMPVGLWMVESGRINISRISGRGKSVILEVLEAGDLAGLASAVGDVPYETGAQTCGTCRLRILGRADFLRILQSDGETCAAVAGMLAAEVIEAHRWIGNTTLARSSAARLARFLLNATASELTMITHLDLASRIGVSREGCTRLLRDLKQSGALCPQLGLIRVQNRQLLERLSS
jgi:CRP-like cAMP-binding protein